MATPQSEEAAALLRSALNALPMEVAVLAEDGVIRYTNRAWRTFGTANGLEEPVDAGTDYLAVREAADEAGSEAADGVRAVLTGDRDEFSMEYACHGPDEKRWFQMLARRFETPVEGPAGGTYALLVHHDVTGRDSPSGPPRSTAGASEPSRVSWRPTWRTLRAATAMSNQHPY